MDDADEPVSRHAATRFVASGRRSAGLKGDSARGAASGRPTQMKPAPRFAFLVSGISQG